jgi:3-dehydroquinate dehydratase-2
MPLVSVIHGPNLNLLGLREPELYGTETLEALNLRLVEEARNLGLELELFQSNHEGELVDRIQQARERAEVLVLNAAGYTHSSVAIRDAVAAIRPLPTLEVHLTLPAQREPFRRRNLLEGVVKGRIEGFGGLSYLLALRAASELIAARGNLRDQ